MSNLLWLAIVFCVAGNVWGRSANAQPVYRDGTPKFKKVDTDSDASCIYQYCNAGKKNMLNVHIVPHSHEDTGWTMTVDQYYYQRVQYILDNVIQVLRNDPNRRFTYVEMAFFYRWWMETHDSVRHYVKKLVNEGRLQFILGGWVMNDEASTHYNSIIDQHTLGFRLIHENFGDCGMPRVGWQIDPFGHSREQASLFAQFGFDGLFFGRLDYQDKNKRLKDKTMEMMWRGSANLGDQGVLFTGVNYNGYSTPPGFCFDAYCSDPPVMDDKRLNDYNVDNRVKAFLKYVKAQASKYTTNHIMLTMGGDFQFRNALQNFKNLDKLIAHVNEQQASTKVNVFYSTPNCYLYALNQANQTYTDKSDDFFPYAHRAHSFWTGYFTSRPALKYYVRNTNNFLQACKQLDVISDLEAQFGSDYKIKMLQQAMGLVQHHDAVSGTERQDVAYDYALRLARGIQLCQEVVSDSYGKLLPKSSQAPPTQTFCPLVNITVCNQTEGSKQFTVIVYNPLGRAVHSVVQVPVTGHVVIQDASMKDVPFQILPVSAQTRAIPERKGSKATGSLVFIAELPALGFNTYFINIKQDAKFKTSLENLQPVPSTKADISIKNEYISLEFDENTGLLKSITNLEKSLKVPVKQSLEYYLGMQGNNSREQFQASGAYIFRPQRQQSTPISSKVNTSVTAQGAVVQEVTQIFSNWSSQVIRLYAGERFAEFEWTVGPIPIGDKQGREVISLFSTDLATHGTFYTDANGREVLKRVRDFRPTWKLNQTEPVSGNYYPVNSRIYIQDRSRDIQLTVLTDRSQGGSSVQDGQIELMVHRRTLKDDALGVDEALNEKGADGKGLIVRGKHYVLLDKISDSVRLQRQLAERLFMAPIVTFADLKMSTDKYKQAYQTQWSSLKTELPANVHLLTLEGWRRNATLLRLEHFYEKGEDPKPASVSLASLFSSYEVESVEEVTLGANQKLAEAKRMSWKIKGQGNTNGDMSSFVTPVDPETWTVKLNPMQIRTFEVVLKHLGK